MIRDLHGRTALVTGATSGLGAAIARRLAAEGMRVAISGRKADVLNTLRDELRRSGAVAAPVIADVSTREGIQRLVADTEAAVGPIDVLVNNAALTELFCSYAEITTDEIDEFIDVNLKAPML